MKLPGIKKLLDQGRQTLDDAARAAGVESGSQGVLDKLQAATEAGQQHVAQVQEGVARAAGRQLDRLTGDDSASQQVAAGYQRAHRGFESGMQSAMGAYDEAAEATAEKLTEATGHEVSKRSVKVAMAVGAAVVVGAADGLGDVATEGAAGTEAAEAAEPSAATEAGGDTKPEINMSQNGTVVSDGQTTYASAGGVTVKG